MMDYVKEYIMLLNSQKPSCSTDSVMQRADKRYKRLVEKGIIVKEDPFIATNETISNVSINK